MKHPVLDPRDLDAIRAQVAALARSYTPEWRYEQAEDDPGAALAELFCTMFYQTVDRVNALPAKLYTEFLNQIGYQEPGPVSARGEMAFDPSEMVDRPVPVRSGTRVFAPGPDGENVVFETQRSIEASPAKLLDLYYVDAAADQLQKISLERPQPFFTPCGEEMQAHSFTLAENNVLRLEGPAAITLELRQGVRYFEDETARLLAESGLQWSYRHGGVWLPFDSVKADAGRIVLEKRTSLAMEPDQEGRICIRCAGRPPMTLTVEQTALTSAPLEPCPAQQLFAGDLPIEGEGYCFGSRPAAYSLFYIRSDTVLSKAGARAALKLDISPIVFDPPAQGPEYRFSQPIIDKRSAVAAKPDDVRVAGVVWEYYNGVGWRQLEVSGSRNPFSCRQEGPYETIFRVPEDLQPAEVNAETGYYIRARVAEVENAFSMYQRWIVPFCKGASLQWQYEAPSRAAWIASDNNGVRREMDDAARVTDLQMTLLEPLEPGPPAVYLRFDRSPHAMPLSVYFKVDSQAKLNTRLEWEQWNGKAFAPVRAVDETDQLLHSGEMYLFLPEELPERSLFGQTGCWLRLSRAAGRPGPAPMVRAIRLNVAPALQRSEQPEQIFDTGIYEAGKALQLLSAPVQGCEVWVDEMEGLSAAEAEELGRTRPDAVRLEREDHLLRRCWVRWEETADLALAGEGDRVYTLDPYQGVIRFGDGRQGRVPPAGSRNIRVRYASGGGAQGNLPAGAVQSALAGLPRISVIQNITPMSGGIGRLTMDEIEARGSRHLRTRGRAAGSRDYEDLVMQAFPQVQHVRCFAGRDPQGQPKAGHVTVALTGHSMAGESLEALCQEVYQYLSGRCSCCLVAEGRLHVCPATLLTVNVQVAVELERPELAADTQYAITAELRRIIGEVWQARPIGAQIRMDELWGAVRQMPNVRRVLRLLAEGAYDEQGQARLAPLEKDSAFPYAVVENGVHTVRVQ